MRLAGLLVCACAASQPAPAPPPAPAAAAPTRVFLSVLGNQLVPLGCWDGKTLRGDCVALVPAGTRLSVGTVSGRETWSCEANGETRDALVYQGTPPETEHAQVLWPDGTLVGAEPAQATDAERAAILEVVKRKDPKIVSVTVGPHRLHTVTVENDETSYTFSGLFVSRGAAVQLLFHSELETYQPLGGVDLDSDGALELWIFASYYEGAAELLIRLGAAGAEPEQIGSWACGA